MGKGDTVILRSIQYPSMDECDEIFSQIRKSAKKAGLKKSDIESSLKRVRRQK